MQGSNPLYLLGDVECPRVSMSTPNIVKMLSG